MPANPNHGPVPTPELSTEARTMFDIQKLEEWRQLQHEALNRLRATATDSSYASEFKDSVDDMLDNYLRSNGIEESNGDYGEVRQLFEDASITNIHDNVWSNRPSSRGETSSDDKSESSLFEERISNRIDAINDPTDDPDVDPTDGAAEEERRVERLEGLRKAKHEAYVNRVNSSWVGRKKATHAYETAEAAYSEALKEDIRRQLDEQLDEEVNDGQRKDFIDRLGEQLLASDDQTQYDTLIEKGGWRAKMLAKYDKLSRAKKIGAALALAAGGAAAGFVAGAAGATVAAVGGGMAVYRFGYNKFLGASRMFGEPRRGNADKFVFDPSASASAEDQITQSMNTATRNRIERADKIRRRAVANGLGAAAIGGVFGAAGVLMHAGDMPLPATDSRVGLNDGHWKAGFFEYTFSTDADVGSSLADSASDDGSLNPTSESDRQLPLPPDMHEVEDSLSTNERGPTPNNTLAEAERADGLEVTADQPEIVIPDYTVSAGEGWFTAFDNLGVNEANHVELLKDIGPQLQDMGVAYPMEDGQWGISSAGELPHEATELIMMTAHENGWLGDAALEQTLELPVVPDGGGLNEFVNTNYDRTLTHEQSLDLGEHLESQPETEDFLYQSDYLLNNYDNPHGINEPGMINSAVDEAIREYVDEIAVGETGTTVGPEQLAADVSAEQIGLAEDTPSADQESQVVEGSQTDETGVDVDDESLSPDEVPVADVDTQLTAIEKDFANERIASLIDSGNYQLLNQLDAPGVDISQLAEQFAGMNYSDGTPLVEAGSGGEMQFNEQPDDARLPNQAIDMINSFLEQAGLDTYSYDTFNQAVTQPVVRP